MKVYVVDAFTEVSGGGNPAGVVLLEKEPYNEEQCQKVAAILGCSETAFVRWEKKGSFQIRYFTPVCEVELCGHATIATFSLLRELNMVEPGIQLLETGTDHLTVEVGLREIWMDMAKPQLISQLETKDAEDIYEAFHLTSTDYADSLPVQIVSTGLNDIMLPVKNHESIMKAVQDEQRISELSQKYHVCGVHMFCLPEDSSLNITAYCSNFAPLVDIPEEAATGTANGALTYYLYQQGRITEQNENLFLQGEHMNRPSKIKSRLTVKQGEVHIQIGGNGVMRECRDII